MNYPRKKILLLALLFEGGLLIVALVLAAFLRLDLLHGNNNVMKGVLYGTALAIPPFGLFLLSLSKRAERIPFVGSLKKLVIHDIRHFFAQSRVTDLIFISLMAGIGEEALFRGVIQQQFGIVAASIVFGLAHCISPAYVIVTVIMGLYIGFIYQATQSLLVPVQLHFVYDLAALLYLRYAIDPASKLMEDDQ